MCTECHPEDKEIYFSGSILQYDPYSHMCPDFSPSPDQQSGRGRRYDVTYILIRLADYASGAYDPEWIVYNSKARSYHKMPTSYMCAYNIRN